MKTWNKRAKHAREQANLTATEVANAIGVSNATISDWESGVIKKLSGDNMLKFCGLLGISPDWLMFGKGKINQQNLSDDDYLALQISQKLTAKERQAWYRVGYSLAEPEESTHGKQ